MFGVGNKMGSTCLNKVYYSFLEKPNYEVLILNENTVFEVFNRKMELWFKGEDCMVFRVY